MISNESSIEVRGIKEPRKNGGGTEKMEAQIEHSICVVSFMNRHGAFSYLDLEGYKQRQEIISTNTSVAKNVAVDGNIFGCPKLAMKRYLWKHVKINMFNSITVHHRLQALVGLK